MFDNQWRRQRWRPDFAEQHERPPETAALLVATSCCPPLALSSAWRRSAGFRRLVGLARRSHVAPVSRELNARTLRLVTPRRRRLGRRLAQLAERPVVHGAGRDQFGRALFDVTVMVEVPRPVLRQRLTARWQGYALPPEEVARKVEGVDLPNGRFVRNESVAADYRIVVGTAG